MEFAEPMDDERMNALLAEQAELQEKIDAEDGWELDRRDRVRARRAALPAARQPGDQSSGGEKRRVALCRLLLEKPDLLLLDEPTNHLDAESVAWLENTLQEYAGTVMIVTHDRYFLDNVTNWILESSAAAAIRSRAITPPGWTRSASACSRRRRRKAPGSGRSPPSRNGSPLAARAPDQEPRAHPALRGHAGKSQEKAAGVADIVIPPGPRLGGTVIEAEKVRKAYGNNLLIDDLDFRLPPGGIVGVIGPNGAGKTTLFRMIIGQETPDTGTLEVGETVKLGYVDQSRDSLDAERRCGRKSPAAPT